MSVLTKRPGRAFRRGDAVILHGRQCWLGSKSGHLRVIMEVPGATTGRMVPIDSPFYPAPDRHGHFDETLAAHIQYVATPLHIIMLLLQVDQFKWVGAVDVRVGKFVHWTGPLGNESEVQQSKEAAKLAQLAQIISVLLKAAQEDPSMRPVTEQAAIEILKAMPPTIQGVALAAGKALHLQA